MSVLIKGMGKPEHCGYCRFRYDGICHALQKTQYSMNECPLVVIDDAGLNDTISRQAAIDGLWSLDAELRPSEIDAILNMLNGLPSEQPTLQADAIDVSDILALVILIEELVEKYFMLLYGGRE